MYVAICILGFRRRTQQIVKKNNVGKPTNMTNVMRPYGMADLDLISFGKHAKNETAVTVERFGCTPFTLTESLITIVRWTYTDWPLGWRMLTGSLITIIPFSGADGISYCYSTVADLRSE